MVLGLFAGFTAARLISCICKVNRKKHEHIVMTAFYGFGLYAIISGLFMTVLKPDPLWLMPVMIPIFALKLSELILLGTLFVSCEYSRQKSISLVLVYALFTPIALMIGQHLPHGLPVTLLHVIMGFATGTFIYIVVIYIVQEVFRCPERRWFRFGMMAVGLLIALGIVNV